MTIAAARLAVLQAVAAAPAARSVVDLSKRVPSVPRPALDDLVADLLDSGELFLDGDAFAVSAAPPPPAPAVAPPFDLTAFCNRLAMAPRADRWGIAHDAATLTAIARLDARDFGRAEAAIRAATVVPLKAWRAAVDLERPTAPQDAASPPPPPSIPALFQTGSHVELAAYLLKDIAGEPAAPLAFDVGELHIYQPAKGLWIKVDRAVQSCTVQSLDGARVGDGARVLSLSASDIAGAIKLGHDRAAAERGPGFFAQAPAGMAFANGFFKVDIRSAECIPHAEGHRARFGYDFSYDPSLIVKCPKWLDFLHSLCIHDADRIERIAFLQQFFGACLVGIATRRKKALILSGPSDNGKSTLIDIVKAAFPAGSCTAISPQHWGEEYKRAQLSTARLNAVSELPEADILDAEAFKAIISGDQINARFIRQDPFDYHPTAGHIFAANRLPGTNDHTNGFWNRLAVLPLTRTFTDKDKDPNIARDIIAAELPAIVAWMLDGAKIILEKNAYDLPPSHYTALDLWRKEADTVATFVDQCTTIATLPAGTKAMVLYKVYRRWSETNGFKPMNIKHFGSRMRRLGLEPDHENTGNIYPVGLSALGEDIRARAEAESMPRRW